MDLNEKKLKTQKLQLFQTDLCDIVDLKHKSKHERSVIGCIENGSIFFYNGRVDRHEFERLLKFSIEKFRSSKIIK